MEKCETYRYLRVDILSDGRMDEEVNHRITEEESMVSIERRMEKEAYISRGKSRTVLN